MTRLDQSNLCQLGHESMKQQTPIDFSKVAWLSAVAICVSWSACWAVDLKDFRPHLRKRTEFENAIENMKPAESKQKTSHIVCEIKSDENMPGLKYSVVTQEDEERCAKRGGTIEVSDQPNNYMQLAH